MRHWIFQGNPNYSDVDTYISTQDYIWWLVNQSYFRDQMSQEAKVFICRSRGKSADYKTYGIIAEATLSNTPSLQSDDANALWKNSKYEPTDLELRVPISITSKSVRII